MARGGPQEQRGGQDATGVQARARASSTLHQACCLTCSSAASASAARLSAAAARFSASESATYTRAHTGSKAICERAPQKGATCTRT